MSFLSDLFKRKPKEPEPPRTRQDMEDSLSVQYVETYTIDTAQRTLQHSFTKQRPPQEEEAKQLKEVFDLIASVPQGQKLLDEVAQGGYEFFFETTRGANDGCMYAGTKKIMLCPCQHSSIAGLAATAFHEMTHAVQNDRTKGKLDYKCANMNMADQFKFQRAAEAAAWTEEAKFAYQIRDQHPDVERHVAKFPMYQAFAEEMEKSGDMAKAGEACFKAWYGYKHYQTAYEANHVENISYFIGQGCIRKEDTLAESMSSEDVLKNVFVSDDIKQNISPDFLTSKEAFSVSKEAIERLENTVKLYYKDWKQDPSLHNMYSYETGQTYASQEQPKEAAAASVRLQEPTKIIPTEENQSSKTDLMKSLTKLDKAAKVKRAAAAKAKTQTAQH
ncbi:MAG: hypothetical protein IJ752_03850 [Alphaproteobacteria bacterium]|nr:hypothetical protein [Alphaproteobacteria bacterium]